MPFLVIPSQAQVRINEISATSSDRLITRNSEGIPHLGSGIQWWEAGYDDSFWLAGQTPIGSGYAGIYTNVSSKVIGVTPSFYVRQEFMVSKSEALYGADLSLDIDYGDAFVAYLNGKEIGRGNAAAIGSYLHADQPAYNIRVAGSFQSFLIGPTNAYLLEGHNILSVEVHNNAWHDTMLKLDLVLSNSAKSFLSSGDTCKWFPGIINPSGGVFDYRFLALAGEPPEVEFSDWIELHNSGAAAIDISGWGLSDNSDPLKWRFPPGTSINAGDYLLLLADEQDDFNGQGAYLHTNFKLDKSGETVTLSDAGGVLQSEIPGGFPKQYNTYTYGWIDSSSTWGYFANATPGAQNSPAVVGEVFSDHADAPDFEPKGGFYEGAQTISLTSDTQGAQIRYTFDGTEPTSTTGSVYSGPFVVDPVNIRTGTVVRARSFAVGQIPSKTKTHTFLIDQHPAINTIPALIFSGDPEESFYKPHGIMAIVGGVYIQYKWSNTGPDSYNIPAGRGRPYERPCHLEFYPPDGSPGFREDAGIRLSSSGASRPRLLLTNTNASPWSSTSRQKPSFNLYFRSDYGKDHIDYAWHNAFPYRVTNFEQLRIRAGKNDIKDPWIKDELVRRLYHDMGQESSIGITNTLYINGSFKGFFNMTERLREPFMQAHHGGDFDWDVRQVNTLPNGDDVVWNEMMTALGEDLTDLANWQSAEAYLDAVNMADYFLLNIYCATGDWPRNNWVGARERSSQGRYRLYVWDAEFSFGSGWYRKDDVTVFTEIFDNNNTLATLFQKLHSSPEWRLLFADRINKHMFHGGVLDGRGASSHLRQRANELRDDFAPIKAFVHRGDVTMSFCTNWVIPDDARRNYLLGPIRSDFADFSLWPSTNPPEFNQHGGSVVSGFGVTMDNGTGDTIHYTTDGSDPRNPGGAIGGTASTYSSAVELVTSPVTIRARARDPLTGEWSALTETEFNLGLVPPSSSNLVVSEFMYHPANPSTIEEAAGFTDDGDFEFLELKNTDSVLSVDLSDVVFTSGITFAFGGTAHETLGPNQRVIIVRNLAGFQERYGHALDSRIAGEFADSLSNGGELVTLSVTGDPTTVLHSFTYLDKDPWAACADGDGHSLVLLDPDSAPDHDDAVNWTFSRHFGGELGGNYLDFDFQVWVSHNFSAVDAANPAVSAELADPDDDGLVNLLEFAFGTDPTLWSSVAQPIFRIDSDGVNDFFTASFQRPKYVLPFIYEIQVSDDLNTWLTLPEANIVAAVPIADPISRFVQESWRITTPVRAESAPLFFRFKVEFEGQGEGEG